MWSVCFQWEERQALTHVLHGHMTVALDRQGMKQNAPVLALPASHSTEIGCLPVQPHLGVCCLCSLEYTQMRFSIEPPAGDRGMQESLLISLFPWSIWHCMATFPSVCVNSKTSRNCFAWGDRRRAGDLGCSGSGGVPGWPWVQSGMPRTRRESSERCPLELVWKVAGSSS